MVEKGFVSKEELVSSSGRPRWLARLLAGALGLIFLTAALSKATDLGLFVRQMGAYSIISGPLLLTSSAWGLIALECGLGIGLLVSYRPRVTLSLTIMLLLVFLGATSWASISGAAAECGCFGAWLKRTPKAAAIESLILLAIAVLAWRGYAHSQTHQSRAKALAVVGAFIIGLILPVAFGFSFQQIGETRSRGIGIDVSKLEIEGVKGIDLAHSAYLLALIDLDCAHCTELIEELNMLAEEPGIPAVLGLCLNEESRRRSFEEEFQPAFPIGHISESDFWRLLADADVPRTLYVRDGQVRRAWDQTVPDKEEVKTGDTP